MTVTILPTHLRGQVTVPASKSVGHRYLIAAALADGESRLTGVTLSDDLLATCDCLRALGRTVTLTGTTVTVRGGMPLFAEAPLPCRSSGTTLRLLLPLCLVGGKRAALTGTEQLFSRPLGVYEDFCREQGFLFSRGAASVTVEGHLSAGEYRIPAALSSQFVSGLLFALAANEGESTLTLTGRIGSRPYIDLTLDAMQAFGVDARWEGERTIHIPDGSRFRAGEHAVEGDWSAAAFWEALASIGEPVETRGVRPTSHQGDRVCRSYFAALRAGTPTLSIADCPDLAPILMTVAALSNGVVLTETARLRIKESDRGAAMARELEKCGVTVIEEADRITVLGRPTAPTVPLCGHEDHRIVMALAILLTRLGGTITGAEAVSKSYPAFFQDLAALGVRMEVQEYA